MSSKGPVKKGKQAVAKATASTAAPPRAAARRAKAAKASEDDDPSLGTYFISKDTQQRKRDCDGAVAQIHKIAYKVLYGSAEGPLNYDLQPSDRAKPWLVENASSGAGADPATELKDRLQIAALHWA